MQQQGAQTVNRLFGQNIGGDEFRPTATYNPESDRVTVIVRKCRMMEESPVTEDLTSILDKEATKDENELVGFHMEKAKALCRQWCDKSSGQFFLMDLMTQIVNNAAGKLFLINEAVALLIKFQEKDRVVTIP